MSENVTLEFIKNLKQDTVLIDVRQPEEIKSTGTIPGSINIPLSLLEDAFELNNEEFNRKFGKNTPTKDSLIVFSCQCGIRSLRALNTAKKLGFLNVKHFPGGWAAWEKSLQE